MPGDNTVSVDIAAFADAVFVVVVESNNCNLVSVDDIVYKYENKISATDIFNVNESNISSDTRKSLIIHCVRVNGKDSTANIVLFKNKSRKVLYSVKSILLTIMVKSNDIG